MKKLSVSLLLLGLFLVACKGGGTGGGSNIPAAPSAVVPAGCSGSAINGITIRFGSNGVPTQRFSIQIFGETVSGQAPPFFNLTRAVVPCDYELVGQILEASSPIQVAFGFPDGTRAPERGGVVPSSIVAVEGPNHRLPPIFGSQPAGCLHQFGDAQTPLPATFRLRFRVSADVADGSRC
jgi:hypothetical protein